MSSWSGFWHYIRMASLHLISSGGILSSVLERNLAITLKTLLILETLAKVTFIVMSKLLQKGTTPQPRKLNYKHSHRYFQLFWVVLLQTIRYVRPLVLSLHLYTSRTGTISLVPVSKCECLTVPQVYSTRIWRPASHTRFVQGSRIVEA